MFPFNITYEQVILVVVVAQQPSQVKSPSGIRHSEAVLTLFNNIFYYYYF